MIRYTLHGSALKDDVAALREEIAALKAAAQGAVPPVAPESTTARETFAGYTAERAANAAAQIPGFWCARHGGHGFAFKKAVCPRDGGPLA